MTAYIKKGENSNRSLETVLLYNRLDEYLLSVFTAKEQSFNLKELRKEAENETGKSISPEQYIVYVTYFVQLRIAAAVPAGTPSGSPTRPTAAGTPLARISG
ncbi:MAG: hypothetical protein V8T16_01770 [Parabacteroides merdae]